MTLPRVQALSAYWQRHPPVHLLVAGYLGYEGKSAKPAPASASELIGLLGAMGGGHIDPAVLAELAKSSP